jgi:hypothetical protein
MEKIQRWMRESTTEKPIAEAAQVEAARSSAAK